MCCEKKTMTGWRNVWSMKWSVPGQEVDQRKLGQRLWKKIVRHVNWTRRILWCEWVNVSFGTSSHRLSRSKTREPWNGCSRKIHNLQTVIKHSLVLWHAICIIIFLIPHLQHKLHVTATTTNTTIILWQFYIKTCVSEHLQLNSWSKVLLPAYPSWRSLVHLVHGEDARFLLSGAICIISIHYTDWLIYLWYNWWWLQIRVQMIYSFQFNLQWQWQHHCYITKHQMI